ncbi:hypothetical protein HDR58_05120 [bacterium]|nr:hypothetical protein [bacterium]
MFVFLDNEANLPEGYRRLSSQEIMNNYLKMDLNKDYTVSKNEWMFMFIKLLEKDIDILEKEGPDSIMNKIQELSDEFDRYDVNGNKKLDYEEYKSIITNRVYISE